MMFAQEFKQKMIDNGQRNLDMNKIVALAGPHWQKLSAEEVLVYKTKADSLATLDDRTLIKRAKLNCKSEEIEEAERTADEETMKSKEITENIKQILNKADSYGGDNKNMFEFNEKI